VKTCKKHPTAPRYENGRCKICVKEANSKWEAANPEKRREIHRRWVKLNPEKIRVKKNRYSAKWRAANPEEAKRRSRRRSYVAAGMDPAKAAAILAAHNGKCDCCGADKSGGQGWQVDHDHASGAIRGVLCFYCNTAIGKLGDNLEGVMNAVRYLEKGAVK